MVEQHLSFEQILNIFNNKNVAYFVVSPVIIAAKIPIKTPPNATSRKEPDANIKSFVTKCSSPIIAISVRA